MLLFFKCFFKHVIEMNWIWMKWFLKWIEFLMLCNVMRQEVYTGFICLFWGDGYNHWSNCKYVSNSLTKSLKLGDPKAFWIYRFFYFVNLKFMNCVSCYLLLEDTCLELLDSIALWGEERGTDNSMKRKEDMNYHCHLALLKRNYQVT